MSGGKKCWWLQQNKPKTGQSGQFTRLANRAKEEKQQRPNSHGRFFFLQVRNLNTAGKTIRKQPQLYMWRAPLLDLTWPRICFDCNCDPASSVISCTRPQGGGVGAENVFMRFRWAKEKPECVCVWKCKTCMWLPVLLWVDHLFTREFFLLVIWLSGYLCFHRTSNFWKMYSNQTNDLWGRSLKTTQRCDSVAPALGPSPEEVQGIGQAPPPYVYQEKVWGCRQHSVV